MSPSQNLLDFKEPNPFYLGSNSIQQNRLVTSLMDHIDCLFRIVLDVVALQLDKLLESKSAQSHTATRVLPASPGQIL